MNERLAELLIALFRPYERWRQGRIKRAYARGKFRKPEGVA